MDQFLEIEVCQKFSTSVTKMWARPKDITSVQEVVTQDGLGNSITLYQCQIGTASILTRENLATRIQSEFPNG